LLQLIPTEAHRTDQSTSSLQYIGSSIGFGANSSEITCQVLKLKKKHTHTNKKKKKKFFANGRFNMYMCCPSWMKYNNENRIPVDHFLADALLELDMGYLNCGKSSFS
jgi:hypothetical protein